MRSSEGQHFVALDHLRALAAYLVFSWHFLHADTGYPVAFDAPVAVLPWSILDEGHTGVSLFMVLSGYLFAKILDGRQLIVRRFLWNRFVRLFPLLVFVWCVCGYLIYLGDGDLRAYAWALVQGLVMPTLPNGGWSLTVEFHFYLVLPLLLMLAKKTPLALIGVLASAMLLRVSLFLGGAELQDIAYWTIIGRIDQFVLGILGHLCASRLASRGYLLAVTGSAFLVFWAWFNSRGGFYGLPGDASTNLLWVFIPTLEGIFYASLITWYDGLTLPSNLLTRLVQKLGQYSYSIYLLHFFLVFEVASYVHENIMDISNFFVAMAWSTLVFIGMIVPGFISFRYLEEPFLAWRRSYAR